MTPHHDKDFKWVTWPTLILLICFMGMAILSMGCATSERVRTGHIKGSSNKAMWRSLGHPNPAWYIQGASNNEGKHVPLAWITDIILPLDENGEPIQNFKWEWDEQ